MRERSLPVSGAILSPYWHTQDLNQIGTGRNIPNGDSMKAYLDNFIVTAGGTSYAGVTFIDDANSNAFVENVNLPSDFSACTSAESIFTQAKIDILAYAVTKSYSVPSVFGMFATTNSISGLANAPQAAIANAPADAVTNYNTVTTLLGALTGAVNTANTKQNDIATKLNTLFAELRTLGLIST